MQTRTEIEARLAELRAANEAAPGWGAAVGARLEEIRDLERQLRALDPPAPAPIPLADLPLYWQGRANALRQLNAARNEPDEATEQAAAAYQECAAELRTALDSGAAG